MAKQPDKIIFVTSVSSIKTLVDGGIRISLDLPEDAIRQAAMLMECKREMIPLQIEVKKWSEDES